jgi:SAM-dependent methyltransferase
MINQDMAHYYAMRASEYENIYKRPERQQDIAALIRWLKGELADRDILEVACGTGYWTQYASETARSILATDINPDVIAIAETKAYPRQNVRFALADIYALPDFEIPFNCVFGGFIWSHIPLPKLEPFLAEVNRRAGKGGKVVFVDGRYVEGSNLPVVSRDADGNTYQERTLSDGTRHRVIKNFPSPAVIHSQLAGRVSTLRLIHLTYYWLLAYEL